MLRRRMCLEELTMEMLNNVGVQKNAGDAFRIGPAFPLTDFPVQKECEVNGVGPGGQQANVRSRVLCKLKTKREQSR